MNQKYPRTLGEKIALSIGTAIPFEETVMVENLPIEVLWINIRTLYRNYRESYEAVEKVPKDYLAVHFLEEIRLIQSLLTDVVPLILYETQNKRLVKRFPHALVKEVKTMKQKLFNNDEGVALRLLNAQLPGGVKQIEQKLIGDDKKAWVMTSYPLDLLSRFTFSQLTLLSSHTGHLKLPSSWIQYLTSNANYHRLPFSMLTLQLLGDKSKQFKSYSLKYKKPLLALADENNWTPLTTRSKLLFDIEKIKESGLRELYKSMLLTSLK